MPAAHTLSATPSSPDEVLELAERDVSGSTEENKTVLTRIVEEVINNGNYDVAGELVASNYVYHALPGSPDVRGLDGYKQLITAYRRSLPDLQVTVHDMIAEGDKVAVRFAATATQGGEFSGMPSTGKRMTITGMNICRFAGGKLVDHSKVHGRVGFWGRS
jgi:steroid delta-isomerase-like uncharacterized protein